MIAFPLKLLEVIYIAAFDPLTLRRVLESFLTIGLYAIIGLGQLLIVLAPIFQVKLKKSTWQSLHLWVVIASTLAVLAYSLFPNLRLGLELLNGYYLWNFSFILMCVASVLHIRKETDFGAEKGKLSSSQS